MMENTFDKPILANLSTGSSNWLPPQTLLAYAGLSALAVLPLQSSATLTTICSVGSTSSATQVNEVPLDNYASKVSAQLLRVHDELLRDQEELDPNFRGFLGKKLWDLYK